MEPLAPNSSTRFGIFELDLHSGELRKAGTRIRLQDQPLKILIALLEHPGAVVTREELKRRIWPYDSSGDFDHAVNVAVAKLRAALSDSADTPRYVETLPRRGYRFISPVAAAGETPLANPAVRSGTVQAPVEKRVPFIGLRAIAIGSIALALLATSWWSLAARKAHRKLTDKDTVVLGDFDNTTGDAVFDGTMRQGLAVQLEQSPFLSLVSDATVRQTLRLMNQPPDARLTPEIAQQLCLRTGSSAVLNGSIAKLGNQYVLGLKATNCATGDSLVQEQVTAEKKEEILNALAQAASRLRTTLGESVGTVQKYNTPLEQVTTPSLQALHAYSLGRTTLIDKEDQTAAIQLFQRAILLDPNFAMAYASLGLAYAEYSEQESVANYRKAYELREHVSDRERLYIEAHYQESVKGDWEKARQAYQLWSQLYPRDDIPHLNASEIDSSLGQYEDARRESAESLRLLPGDCLSTGVLVGSLIRLERLAEARALMKNAEERSADCFQIQVYRYALAFLDHDNLEMERIANNPATQWKLQLTYIHAQTAAYSGQLRQSRGLMRRVDLLAQQPDHEQLGGLFDALGAISEVLFGNEELAKMEVKEVLSRSRSRDAEGLADIVLALVHDENGAQSLANDLGKRFPDGTLMQSIYLPSVRAQLALNHGDTQKAVEALQMTVPYEVGSPSGDNPMFPIYLRGQAYLMAGRGSEAAAEFQKILEHPGIVLNAPIGALAHLEIARAFTLQGETAKARAAYQDFLTLWKDADSEIPVMKQAKAEYAKLH
jgi:eukaryotic-like serine/threonine-protein kinase